MSGSTSRESKSWYSLTSYVKNIWVLSNKHDLNQPKQTWEFIIRIFGISHRRMQQSRHEKGRGQRWTRTSRPEAADPGAQFSMASFLSLSADDASPRGRGKPLRAPTLTCYSFSCLNYAKKVVPAFQLSNGKDMWWLYYHSDKHVCTLIKCGQALTRNTGISGTEGWRKALNCRNLKELQVVQGGQKSIV